MIRTLRRAFIVAATGLASLHDHSASSCRAVVGNPAGDGTEIVRVDPTTGAILSAFTPPGRALMPTQMFGGLTIAEHGAVLLYQNPVAHPTSLFRINPDTGALLTTEFMPAATGTTEFRAGLSFESGAGVGAPMRSLRSTTGRPCSDRMTTAAFCSAIILLKAPCSPGRWEATIMAATLWRWSRRGFASSVPTAANVTLGTIPMPPLPLFQGAGVGPGVRRRADLSLRLGTAAVYDQSRHRRASCTRWW